MVFYVDNIELEHFERQSRVEGQVRREAYRRLRQAGIAFPHVRYEVSLLGGALGGESAGRSLPIVAGPPAGGS